MLISGRRIEPAKHTSVIPNLFKLSRNVPRFSRRKIKSGAKSSGKNCSRDAISGRSFEAATIKAGNAPFPEISTSIFLTWRQK